MVQYGAWRLHLKDQKLARDTRLRPPQSFLFPGRQAFAEVQADSLARVTRTAARANSRRLRRPQSHKRWLSARSRFVVREYYQATCKTETSPVFLCLLSGCSSPTPWHSDR